MFAQHASKFPVEIEAFFSSSWNRHEIWRYDLPVEEVPIHELTWHLDQPFWSSAPPEPLFDLKPRSVLENPQQYSEHGTRILAADTPFAIDAARFGSKTVVLDGLHRLVKLHLERVELIRLRHVPPELIRTETVGTLEAGRQT